MMSSPASPIKRCATPVSAPIVYQIDPLMRKSFDSDLNFRSKQTVLVTHPRFKKDGSVVRGFGPKSCKKKQFPDPLSRKSRAILESVLCSPTPDGAEYILFDPRTVSCLINARSHVIAKMPEADKVECALQHKLHRPLPMSLAMDFPPSQGGNTDKIDTMRQINLSHKLTNSPSKPGICKQMQDIKKNIVPVFIPLGKRKGFLKQSQFEEKEHKLDSGVNEVSVKQTDLLPCTENKVAVSDVNSSNLLQRNSVSNYFRWNALESAGINARDHMEPPWDERDTRLDLYLDQLEKQTYSEDVRLRAITSYNHQRMKKIRIETKPEIGDKFDEYHLPNDVQDFKSIPVVKEQDKWKKWRVQQLQHVHQHRSL